MADRPQGVLVTGSSSGIGAAVARVFAQRGARVVVNSSSSPEAGAAIAAELGGHYVQADIGDPAQAAELVRAAVEHLSRLDVVVNVAGITEIVAFDDLPAANLDVWHRILDVNLLGTWSVISAAEPHLRASAAGHIINITSASGIRPGGSSIPYAVSKAAVNHLTLALAKTLGPTIRVNAIAPGMIDTPWTSDWDDARAWVNETVALRRTGKPEDIAGACLLLADSPYITGAIVPVDGGLLLA